MAESFMARQPILRVAARSVGRPQSDSVPTVNDGISVTFESENRSRIVCSYYILQAAFSVKAGDATKTAKLI